MMDPVFRFDIVQGSEEWDNIRAGKVTGTTAKTLLVSGKGESGFGVGAITQSYRVAHEIITGKKRDSFKGNAATKFGHENEPLAIEEYELTYFRKVQAVGFVQSGEYLGTSPDGLIPDIKKGIECKCLPVEHAKILDTNQFDQDHYKQCQWNLFITKYESWDLVYFHPDFTGSSKMRVFTFKPDALMHDQWKLRVEDFKKLVDKKVSNILNN